MPMAMDPELAEALQMMPPLDFLADLAGARQAMLAQLALLQAAARADVSIDDRLITGFEGAGTVGVRIYRPLHERQRLPGLLWIHGGGFVIGHPRMDDALCQRFAIEAGCLVVSVDWRLAPEHPFPAGLHDAYAALQWMHDEADALQLDGRIAVAGASAGGNLAAALCLLARDRQGPTVRFQMPLYACLDDRHQSPSSHEVTDPRLWHRELSQKAWALYLGSLDRHNIPAYAAPLRAADLSGLPPAYLCVGAQDLLRDENIEYAARLAQAGVGVELQVHPGAFHGFDVVVPEAAISRRASAGYVRALAEAFRR